MRSCSTGPRGVGKRPAAQALAGALLGDPRRVDGGTHPDLRVIEALGEMIRIDEIRALHHDLHMRPFEADRRVYLLLDAQLLNDEAAAALLKDLEEPPEYATLVLVADELGPLPETIRSRCQLVPFRRLSRAAVEGWLAERAPELSADEVGACSRGSPAAASTVRHGSSTTPRAPSARALLAASRAATYLDESFDRPTRPPRARRRSTARARWRRASGSSRLVDGLDLPAREAEQRVKRAGVRRGAGGAPRRRSTTSAAWYRDLVVVASGAEAPSSTPDRLDELREDAARRAGDRRARGRRGVVRQAWREAEEFNLNAVALPRGALRPADLEYLTGVERGIPNFGQAARTRTAG